MNTKSVKGIFSVASVFILLFVLAKCYGPIISYNNEMLLSNKQAYTDFAIFCYKCYDSNNQNEDVCSYAIDERRNLLYCNTTGESFLMNQSIIDSAHTINSTYMIDEQVLDCIYVSRNFVVFANVAGRGSLIYSVDDSRPDFVSLPDENCYRVYVERLTNRWYFVCRQN